MIRRRTAEKKKRAAVHPFAAVNALMPMPAMTGVVIILRIVALRSRL